MALILKEDITYLNKLRQGLVLCYFFSCFWVSAQEIDNIKLEKTLDSLILNGIDSFAFPGAQVYISLDGKTILNKSYGFHTYDLEIPVMNDHVYDLASVTKVTSGLPVLMKLHGESKLDLDKPLSYYFTKLKSTEKAKLTFRKVLAHQAGLQPYIVYWSEALARERSENSTYFSFKYNENYSTKLSDKLYVRGDIKKLVYQKINESKLDSIPQYRYSGLFFLMLPEIIEGMVGQDFESYLYENFFVPMGLNSITYNPRKRFPLDKIVPTEIDDFFRFELVHGQVHDEAAAVLNGISCNAGLFSNASDLGKLFEMFTNDGNLNGRNYISGKSIKEFTRYQYPGQNNRRGLGFDKPLLEYAETSSYVAKSASPESFGHSGFTGTFVWADPVSKLVFVFLSNRVYPSRSSRKIYSMNLRPKMHQLVYDNLVKN